MSLKDPDRYINRLKDKFPVRYQALRNRKEHTIHIAFDLIDHDVKVNKVPWNKCMDCGDPYVVGEGEGNGTFCSQKCELATRKYLGY